MRDQMFYGNLLKKEAVTITTNKQFAPESASEHLISEVKILTFTSPANMLPVFWEFRAGLSTLFCPLPCVYFAKNRLCAKIELSFGMNKKGIDFSDLHRRRHRQARLSSYAVTIGVPSAEVMVSLPCQIRVGVAYSLGHLLIAHRCQYQAHNVRSIIVNSRQEGVPLNLL